MWVNKHKTSMGKSTFFRQKNYFTYLFGINLMLILYIKIKVLQTWILHKTRLDAAGEEELCGNGRSFARASV